jgi:FtsP/CotA-like multicopper oxidase with cupredoxin domain
MNKQISRRDFLKIAGGAMIGVAGAGLLPQFLRKTLHPEQVVGAAGNPDLYFAGTDGWMFLPDNYNIPISPVSNYFPDNLAPAPFNTYIFGFRNITGMTATQISNQKEKAQHNAPLFWATEGQELRLQLTNLGLALRPDLTDSHTLHWHGFRNVIPFFDGEPTGSVSVPVGRDFTYVFRPHDPGTYMYHCHVEDVEHVHMGMTGLVFVRPALGPKYAYNDPATAFDREFAMFLSEVWAEAHWADSHIQLPDWSDYKVDFSLLNGRAYPYTLAPNGSVDPFNPVRDASGDLIAPAGHPELQYQPLSARVTCVAGERVLLRFANLGFRESSMTLAGIKMYVVGRDATPMRGRDGTDTSYLTDTIVLGAGESADVLFTAPAYSGGSGSSGLGYDTYVLYNRAYNRSDGLSGGTEGQRTEVHVFPGGLAAQQFPNDWGGA